MVFKKFRIIVISAILGILILSLGLVYFALQTPYWLVSFWFGVSLVAILIYLIRYVEKWRTQLSDFLLSISHDDFTTKFNDGEKSDSLDTAYLKINEIFKKLRTEKELNHLYLQTIVEHINIALICLDENEDIVIANQAAKKLFNRSGMKNLSNIRQFDEELFHRIEKMKSGQKSLVKLKKGENVFNISVQTAIFKLLDEPYKLISFQDIKAELEEQELDSWKKLVRVLTHEIMNTAIPISTLASVINQMLISETGEVRKLKELNTEEEEDLLHSLKTIEKRSKGIVDFVRVTKSYTSLTRPKLRVVKINDLINHVLDLHQHEIIENKISIKWNEKLNITNLNIDAKLIEQVIINVLRNSIEAVRMVECPEIRISISEKNDTSYNLSFTDNGCGITSEILENIFIPFFTTKKKGSGIGLSLSKQIMKMHQGSIEATSIEGKGSTINLRFY